MFEVETRAAGGELIKKIRGHLTQKMQCFSAEKAETKLLK